ncbi:hypothetical protein GZH82_03970 [Staphylococcus ursi]|uniref:hypothetical protein n=1 Tax=Staphylococcus sp. MI 10-1553 TaxID=1912064 RepID=UPI0013987075|nr:hypothetical protein [Staphylococcus sp. MI 10-1553]QHW36579.1 hypothetical protein GZH82_03970 [Staphylococcus sp. MI 10-1553]
MRLVILLVLISFIVVYFTLGFGWLGHILIWILLILSLSFQHYKNKEDKKHGW